MIQLAVSSEYLNIEEIELIYSQVFS